MTRFHRCGSEQSTTLDWSTAPVTDGNLINISLILWMRRKIPSESSLFITKFDVRQKQTVVTMKLDETSSVDGAIHRNTKSASDVMFRIQVSRWNHHQRSQRPLYTLRVIPVELLFQLRWAAITGCIHRWDEPATTLQLTATDMYRTAWLNWKQTTFDSDPIILRGHPMPIWPTALETATSNTQRVEREVGCF